MPIATPYEDLLRLVLETGTAKSDRTGTGTRSLFGQQIRYDLSAGFPLLTTTAVASPWVCSRSTADRSDCDDVRPSFSRPQ